MLWYWVVCCYLVVGLSLCTLIFDETVYERVVGELPPRLQIQLELNEYKVMIVSVLMLFWLPLFVMVMTKR